MPVRGTLVIVGCLVVFATVAAAQSVRDTLQSVTALSCEFRQMATGTWSKEGAAVAEIKPATLKLAFSDIDTQSGTAVVQGSVGAPEIVVQTSGGYLHFVQSGLTGFLYVTTVFDKVSSDGKLKAVHTRHEYTEVSLPGYTSRPQQYYGDCRIGPGTQPAR